MKTATFVIVFSALSATLLSPVSLAEKYSRSDNIRHIDYARVISSEPIFRTVERRVPVENCWTEQQREETPVYRDGMQHAQPPRKRSATGTILGALIGGGIGNAVGAGEENKKVGTVVGAILGASVGRDISRNGSNRQYSHTEVSYRDVQRCEVKERVEMEEVPAGYSVTYRYNGETYTTRTRRDPGNKLKIAINIQPLEY